MDIFIKKNNVFRIKYNYIISPYNAMQTYFILDKNPYAPVMQLK